MQEQGTAHITLPSWVNTCERASPGSFYDTIRSVILLSHVIHGVLIAISGCWLLYNIKEALDAGIFTAAFHVSSAFGGAFGVLCLLLSWGLITCWLKSMRATFCHQYTVESILAASNNIVIRN